MASVDKSLSQTSAWMSHVAFAGLLALAFLPARSPAPRPPPAAARIAPPVAATAQPAKPAEMQARLPAQSSPSSLTTKDRAIVPPADVARVAPSAAPPTTAPPAAASSPSPPATGATPPVPPPDVWTPEELAAGLRQCVQLLGPATAEVEMEEPLKRGQCGTPAPLALRSVGGAEKVEFSPPPTTNCRLAAALSDWVEKVLQPAAQQVLGSRIKRIVGASSYSCRNVYNNPKLQLSEHATGNAIDIAGFVTVDGRSIAVVKGWGPTERDIVAAKRKAEEKRLAAKAGQKTPAKPKPEAAPAPPTPSIAEAAKKADAKKGRLEKTDLKDAQAKPADVADVIPVPSTTKEAIFLKRLHTGSCAVFATVLGPEANEAHRDHFHLDMKTRRSSHAVCH